MYEHIDSELPATTCRQPIHQPQANFCYSYTLPRLLDLTNIGLSEVSNWSCSLLLSWRGGNFTHSHLVCSTAHTDNETIEWRTAWHPKFQLPLYNWLQGQMAAVQRSQNNHHRCHKNQPPEKSIDCTWHFLYQNTYIEPHTNTHHKHYQVKSCIFSFIIAEQYSISSMTNHTFSLLC